MTDPHPDSNPVLPSGAEQQAQEQSVQDSADRELLTATAQNLHPDPDKVFEARDTLEQMVSLENKGAAQDDLLGKVALHDVFAPDGTQIIASGEAVTPEHLERARSSGFEQALTTAVDLRA